MTKRLATPNMRNIPTRRVIFPRQLTLRRAPISRACLLSQTDKPDAGVSVFVFVFWVCCDVWVSWCGRGSCVYYLCLCVFCLCMWVCIRVYASVRVFGVYLCLCLFMCVFYACVCKLMRVYASVSLVCVCVYVRLWVCLSVSHSLDAKWKYVFPVSCVHVAR